MRGGARDFGQRGKVVKVQICTMIYIYIIMIIIERKVI